MVIPFATGLTFAIGLGIAGMTRPEKILAFLDVAGAWDPTLAFVMVGALAVYVPAYRLIARRNPTLVPRAGDLDARLIGGAAIFGIGWGLVGYCPGPAIVALPAARAETLAFVVPMLAALALFPRPDATSAPGSCG